MDTFREHDRSVMLSRIAQLDELIGRKQWAKNYSMQNGISSGEEQLAMQAEIDQLLADRKALDEMLNT